ncbi:MAG: 4-(cytidine 5'-diphospho)-2-C-methyl-D-erythritol kinase [Thalassobaculum sp.]|uniref:4-(cytidine 5'-diphospho)-2-C-methyl-D-erythritol kinase n=1 Tax=Thalassobaculum sp. TaxID=2022740 RepID=UPI0032EC9A9F
MLGPVVELAPAKINLCLHVTRRRADGYHELDSLVAFAAVGDSIRLEPFPDRVFLRVIDGFQQDSGGITQAVVPAGTDNLAWRALALGARSAGGLAGGLGLSLTKRLPAGAGLGGGSSDAAAVLRALARLSGGRPGGGLAAGAVSLGAVALGADVPMCLAPRPYRARGIGERLQPVALGRDLPAVLAWPGRAVATPAVFAARRGAFGTPVPDAVLAGLAGDDPAAALAELRNDLTKAACAVEPAIGDALAAVGALPGCRLARMSGSGSAVFGLFDAPAEAAAAAAALQRTRPGWWVRATVLRAGPVETAGDPGGDPDGPG